jgi:beta-galactosidase/beta-glucuronidase
MNQQAIEIWVGDVTDMEACVYARYTGIVDHSRPVALRGKLRGPFCKMVRTLPAEYVFRNLGRQQAPMAEAIVTDPCLWTPELPHVYRVDVEARAGDRVVAEYCGEVGLRRLAPRRPVDFAPGTG